LLIRSATECKKRQEQKQAKARNLREKLLAEKADRLHTLTKKVISKFTFSIIVFDLSPVDGLLVTGAHSFLRQKIPLSMQSSPCFMSFCSVASEVHLVVCPMLQCYAWTEYKFTCVCLCVCVCPSHFLSTRLQVGPFNSLNFNPP